ncbi:MAG: beta-ketoacyl-ACP synthase [Treponema sp.]|jgi:3-oxoacyl-[acyl-carrier-protein] synthase II|nr:beta-ketoacyl-ACP synthase [Treponema sp.]
MNLEKRRVVVTGGSIVSPLGYEWPEILRNLKAGKNFIRRIDDWARYKGMNTQLGAPVDFAMPSFPRKKIRGMGRVALLALAATDKALALAGLGDSPELKGGRCGVAYGSSISGVEPIMEIYDMIVSNDVSKINATTYLRAMPQTCAANLEVFYGLTGRLIPTNTACTSGSLAIGLAYEAIKYGFQDIMIAGGAEELSAVDAACFDVLFATSTKNDHPELTPAAYDKSRDGLVVGEGSGTLILEEYGHALNRGAKIYAELAGFGTNTDGSHITQPSRATQSVSIRLALEDAGLDPGKIGYINSHGTATASGDISESWATYDVFKRAVPVSTLKNYIGHTLAACGVIEAWVSIHMMNSLWFCPNINLKEIDPEVAPLDYITGEGRIIDTDYIMSNNFAFGGINTSLIFKRFNRTVS